MKLTRMMETAGTLLLAGAVAFSTATAEAAGPRAHGQGSGVYFHPPFTGDRVSIDLDASGSGGRFDVVHYDKSGKAIAHLTGTVDCVEVNGRTAFTTGTIMSGFASALAGDIKGKSLAITIVDNDGVPDVAGVSYPLEEIPACSAWPINMVMDRGSYTIG